MTRLIRGKSGDIIGYYFANGWVEDIQGRKSVASNYDDAIRIMEDEWSWLVHPGQSGR